MTKLKCVCTNHYDIVTAYTNSTNHSELPVVEWAFFCVCNTYWYIYFEIKQMMYFIHSTQYVSESGHPHKCLFSHLGIKVLVLSFYSFWRKYFIAICTSYTYYHMPVLLLVALAGYLLLCTLPTAS